jgi:diacylglycerol O-acyltransferase
MDQADNPADIVVLMRLSGAIDIADLRRLVSDRLLSRPRFARRLAPASLGWLRPRWELVDAPVELLVQRTLRRAEGDAELRRIIAELISTPFRSELPPWQLCLVEGSGGADLIARVHHCVGDGFALIEVLLDLTEQADPQRSTAERSQSVRSRPALARRSAARELQAVVADVVRVLALPFDRGTRLRAPLSGRREVAWSEPIELERVRQHARRRGSTVNDVLLTALTSALRQHLVASGGIEPVRAVVPVNLRGALAEGEPELGNRFGLVFVDLPVDEPEPRHRFRRIKQEMDRLKAGRQAWATLRLLGLVGWAPLPLARLALQIFSRKATFVVSNVPGPPESLRLAGQEIADLMFWVPHPQGLACGASILSYAGTIRVGVRSDAAVLPDPQVVADAFARELAAWFRAESQGP